MAQDYNETLNLPKTDFPMRAGLPQREPVMLKKWQEERIYEKLMEKNAGKPKFILHDGPPFSNGNIHMGTAMNKVLKDFINRYKAMRGYQTPYVPGWDNHGMPIESAIIKKNKLDRKKMSVPEFRSACREFAMDFVHRQMDQFVRLGVVADWEHPYLTMDPAFEAEEVKVFGEMYRKGYIYKGLKPVYWCPHDETALAEAEIEYAEDPCTSIYVKFQVSDDKGKLAPLCGGLDRVYFVIWTTTPWTIPGNLAICLGPDFEYVLAKFGDEIYIVAQALLENLKAAAHLGDCEILGTFQGRELEYLKAKHPTLDRESLIILGDHVTLDSGTGCVHTAPGHGVDDFNVCKNHYPEIEIVVPVDDRGRMTEEAGKSAGLFVDQASECVIEELGEKGALVATEKIIHQYPHCWRCKKPIIFRATEQWFCSVDDFKEAAVEACHGVTWLPAWGEERIVSMVRERADWCISRQRRWGLPIPVFYCGECGKPVCTDETIAAVSELFGREGSNAWYDLEAEQILPQGFTCPHCGGKHFTKEVDTLDGWFDSGSSHFASLKKRNPDEWPADVYLEGADQYRGWFQSSLLTGVAVSGKAPFKTVLTHGWTVDGEGRKMSKSIGNVVAPEDIMKQYGADILRLWVASSDYRVDVRISPEIFKQLSQAYLKIRNTCRYILGNLNGFDPDQPVPFDQLLELDRWALMRLNRLVEKVLAAYESFEYHLIYHAVYNFCVVDMSNFYLDVIKDRLYAEKSDGLKRRSAQTAMYLVLEGLVKLLAPILAFTSEEVWETMPHRAADDRENILFNQMPKVEEQYENAALEEKWDRILAVRDDVKKALELARNEKVIGASLDAKVTICCQENFDFLKPLQEELRTAFICSELEICQGAGEENAFTGELSDLKITVEPASGEKCERCWIYSQTVGENPEHPHLCSRCAEIVSEA